MNFIAYLRDCDKISWIKALPELHYRSCTDGLDVGLTWLERCSTKSPAHANPLDLQIVIKELSRKLFESILVYPNSSLEMLGVFEDPGIDFFDLAADYVVSLTPDDTPPTFLYFGYQGKAHDLEWWDAFLVSKALGEPLRRWANYHPDSVALCCISWMKNPETRTNFGLQYATKYWTKHVTLSNKNNHDILSSLGETELRDAPPEQQVTLADVVILTQWLEGSPLVQQERQELLSLWEGHSRELESNPNLGLCSAQWKKRLAGVWPEGAWKKYDHDHSTSESPKMWGGAWGTGGWGRLQGGGV
ncbi:hypothetical protein BDZ94DRAFT_1267268 [Collybia nuda]|uniref:Uncharacterized protein n=1 Tax=Collybia nuda TaxID=64659 RepID=A0A9P6CGB5_9AGAR|nr:hypothetical protein BDZ94DRAFT_1267268 [Collybia nuda]